MLIYLTDFGLEKRNDSKDVVMRFNEVVKAHVSKDKLDGFFSVIETVNKLITDKKIYNRKTTE